MNESIKKFLSFRISARSLDDFTRNTLAVTSFINELYSLEAEVAAFDGLNKDKYSELQNKFSAIKTKYESLKEFFTKNQEISGKLGVIEAELERYSKVIDFGSLLGELKNKIDNLNDIEVIIRDFNSLKAIYDRSSEIINKNERVADEYHIIEERVNYLISNKDCLKEIIKDIKGLHITDDNYESLLTKFDEYKTQLESIYDEVLLPKVEEIILILSNYPTELEKAVALAAKIQFIINRIDTDDWGKRRYLTDIKNLKTGFAADYGVLSLTSKSFVTSAACQSCLDKINELEAKIEEVDKAIKQSRKIYDILHEIDGSSDVALIDAKIAEAKNKYRAFKYKARFSNLETDIKDAEKNAKKSMQTVAVNAIKYVETKVFARNAETLTETTLKGYKKKVNDNYSLLDSEHKSKVKYSQIIARIDALIKKVRRQGLHSKYEWFYLLVFVITAAAMVGYYFYTHKVGFSFNKWLFNNPPYFAHKWQHWGLMPWKWVESIKITDILKFFLLIIVFLAAVICMFFCLVGEVLWFLITLIAFGIAWLVLTILSILLHILLYLFPAAIAFFAISSSFAIKTENNVKSPTWLIVTILLILAMGTIAYLNFFKVLVF